MGQRVIRPVQCDKGENIKPQASRRSGGNLANNEEDQQSKSDDVIQSIRHNSNPPFGGYERP